MILLLKRSSELRATYQIRLLAYRASTQGKTLVVEVPKDCKLHTDINALVEQLEGSLIVERR